jgi:hypothetical protein
MLRALFDVDPSTLARVRNRLPALPFLAVLALWLAAAGVVSALTRRVADWFVMTDELLYERLALSIARTGSPVPRVHTEIVSNVNQLYPLLIAPAFSGTDGIVVGLHDAHVLNAFIMASAAVPAYLLARRVTGHAWLPFLVAFATVAVPWIALSSFLLTEVAAYPAFVWAVLAIQVSLDRPVWWSDVLAVLGTALAVFARTQFYALAVVLPLAVVCLGLLRGDLRASLRAHRTLIALYAVGLVVAVGLQAAGHSILGLYSQTAHGNPLPFDLVRSAPAHLAVVALGGGLLPFLVGGAWIVANVRSSETVERHAWAVLAAITIVVVTVEVASFNLRFGGGLVRERYLFYLTPVLLTALAASFSAARWPRWSLAAPLAILVWGFAQAPLPIYEKLNVDTPASILDDWLQGTMHGLDGARTFLALASVVLALAYVEASIMLRRTIVAAALSALLLASLVAETAYAFDRLFRVNGTSGLPVTLDQSSVFAWVDRTITTNSEAVIAPYPVLRNDYWANAGYWWDLEFWNKSVDREAARPREFSVTPDGSFPKVDLRFDPRTGRASYDVDSYIAQAENDTRFHVAGRPLTAERGVAIVFPTRPWRADWVSYGLYPDGWTRPATAARIRVFADPAQHHAVRRTLTLSLLSPENVPPRRVTVRSNAERLVRLDVTSSAVSQTATVCVPAGGHADVTIRANVVSPIPGAPTSPTALLEPRRAGVLVDRVELDGTPGPSCRPTSP